MLSRLLWRLSLAIFLAIVLRAEGSRRTERKLSPSSDVEHLPVRTVEPVDSLALLAHEEGVSAFPPISSGTGRRNKAQTGGRARGQSASTVSQGHLPVVVPSPALPSPARSTVSRHSDSRLDSKGAGGRVPVHFLPRLDRKGASDVFGTVSFPIVHPTSTLVAEVRSVAIGRPDATRAVKTVLDSLGRVSPSSSREDFYEQAYRDEEKQSYATSACGLTAQFVRMALTDLRFVEDVTNTVSRDWKRPSGATVRSGYVNVWTFEVKSQGVNHVLDHTFVILESASSVTIWQSNYYQWTLSDFLFHGVRTIPKASSGGDDLVEFVKNLMRDVQSFDGYIKYFPVIAGKIRRREVAGTVRIRSLVSARLRFPRQNDVESMKEKFEDMSVTYRVDTLEESEALGNVERLKELMSHCPTNEQLPHGVFMTRVFRYLRDMVARYRASA